MSKIAIINKIRNKFFNNIGNKQWFKNYKHKKTNFKNPECFIISVLPSYLLTMSSIGMNENLRNSIEGASFSVGLLSFLGSVFLLTVLIHFSSCKIGNFFIKRNIKKFIKKSENISNEEIIKLINGNKRFFGSKVLVNDILDHTLEKKDLEDFKKEINQHFEKKELEDVFNNFNCNDMIKNKDSIDYRYIYIFLALLDEKCKNEPYNEKFEKMKNILIGSSDDADKSVNAIDIEKEELCDPKKENVYY